MLARHACGLHLRLPGRPAAHLASPHRPAAGRRRPAPSPFAVFPRSAQLSAPDLPQPPDPYCPPFLGATPISHSIPAYHPLPNIGPSLSCNSHLPTTLAANTKQQQSGAGCRSRLQHLACCAALRQVRCPGVCRVHGIALTGREVEKGMEAGERGNTTDWDRWGQGMQKRMAGALKKLVDGRSMRTVDDYIMAWLCRGRIGSVLEVEGSSVAALTAGGGAAAAAPAGRCIDHCRWAAPSGAHPAHAHLPWHAADPAAAAARGNGEQGGRGT